MTHVEQLTSVDITALPPASGMATVGAAIAMGLLYCFVGYRLFRALLALTGFVLAGSVAAALAGGLSQGRLVFMVVAMVLGGVAGALALHFMYRAGVFLMGLLGAGVAAYAALAGRPESWVPWAVVGAGVVGGLVALWLERPMMTLATASLGAYMVVAAMVIIVGALGLQAVFDDPAYETPIAWAMLSCWVALTLVGAVTQFVMFRPKGEG